MKTINQKEYQSRRNNLLSNMKDNSILLIAGEKEKVRPQPLLHGSADGERQGSEEARRKVGQEKGLLEVGRLEDLLDRDTRADRPDWKHH